MLAPPEELVCAVSAIVFGRPGVEPVLLPADEPVSGVTAERPVPLGAPATAAAVAATMSGLDPIVESTIVLPGGNVIDGGGDTVLSVPLSVLGPGVLSEVIGELVIPEIGEPDVDVIAPASTAVVCGPLVTAVEAPLV